MTSNLLNSKFRPLIEVQAGMQGSADMQTPKPIQYKNVNNSVTAQDLATRLLFEIGSKLKVKPLTVAVAAKIYHQFYEAASDDCYDPYLVATTCLYVASKDQDEPIKIRDLINVAHRTLNRDSDVLDLSDEYWNFRDSIVQAELLVLRMINFKIPVPNAQMYLLSYLRTLEAWIPPHMWEKAPVAKLSWTLLQDFHHHKAVIQNDPQLIALAAIYLALQTYGLQIPCTTEQDSKPWHEIFHPAAKREIVWNLVEQLISIYEQDKELV